MARLYTKLLVFMFSVSALFLGVLSVTLWNYSTKSLQTGINDKLTTLCAVRQAQINYFLATEINKAELTYNRLLVLQYMDEISNGVGELFALDAIDAVVCWWLVNCDGADVVLINLHCGIRQLTSTQTN